MFRIRSVVRDAKPLLEHVAKPLGNSFLPSISAEMLTIATCTHVQRMERASSVSCDCNPGFQETVVDEKRCVEMLTLVVVLVPKETSNGSK